MSRLPTLRGAFVGRFRWDAHPLRSRRFGVPQSSPSVLFLASVVCCLLSVRHACAAEPFCHAALPQPSVRPCGRHPSLNPPVRLHRLVALRDASRSGVVLLRLQSRPASFSLAADHSNARRLPCPSSVGTPSCCPSHSVQKCPPLVSGGILGSMQQRNLGVLCVYCVVSLPDSSSLASFLSASSPLIGDLVVGLYWCRPCPPAFSRIDRLTSSVLFPFLHR